MEKKFIGGHQSGVLIKDLPFESYKSVDALNASKLKILHKSEAHLKADLENPKEQTEAMLYGHAFHAALLEPKRFREFLIVEPNFDRRTKQGKLEHKNFHENLKPDQIIVKEEWVDEISGMLESLKNHPTAGPLLTKGIREVCLFWNDDGIPKKLRYDFVTDDGIPIDIKTIQDAHPENCNREIFKEIRLYWVQAGHYSNGAEATGVCNSDVFIFIFIEKKPPYSVCVKTLESPILDVAKSYVKNDLYPRYKKCIETGVWPGYSPHITQADVGTWFLEKYDRQEG